MIERRAGTKKVKTEAAAGGFKTITLNRIGLQQNWRWFKLAALSTCRLTHLPAQSWIGPLSFSFLPLSSSSFLRLRHLHPPPRLVLPRPPVPARLIGPSSCSPNFVACQSHLSSLWRGSIGLLKAADRARSVPVDVGGGVERGRGGSWLLFRIKRGSSTLTK